MAEGAIAWRAGLVLATFVVTAGALNYLPRSPEDRAGTPEEIVLVVRGMAFRRAADVGERNPTLRLRAGSHVRLTIKNEEPGVLHNFAIPSWHVDSGNIPGPGEVHVQFAVPETKGREAYQCTPHAAMMRGGIVVQ